MLNVQYTKNVGYILMNGRPMSMICHVDHPNKLICILCAVEKEVV